MLGEWPGTATGLYREIVFALFLAMFKARCDKVLSSLVQWKVSLFMAGRLKPDDLQHPFQHKAFCNYETS